MEKRGVMFMLTTWTTSTMCNLQNSLYINSKMIKKQTIQLHELGHFTNLHMWCSSHLGEKWIKNSQHI